MDSKVMFVNGEQWRGFMSVTNADENAYGMTISSFDAKQGQNTNKVRVELSADGLW